MKKLLLLLWLLGAAFIIWSGTRSDIYEAAGGYFLPLSYPVIPVAKLLGLLTAETIGLRLLLGLGSPSSFRTRLFVAVVTFTALSAFTFLGAVNAGPHVVAHAAWVVVTTMILILILMFGPVAALFTSTTPPPKSPAPRRR